MKYILALDQGTTSSRTAVFDSDGNLITFAQEEIEQHYPQPGWVEHDPEEIWQSQLRTVYEALKRAHITAGDVAAIGITNQRETTIVWDRASGEPVHRAIVWQDRRTAAYCAELKAAGFEARSRAITGLPLDPYFSGTKVHWLLQNVAGLRDRAERGEVCFGNVDSWLLWKLTGGKQHRTDYTNASRTLLFDLTTLNWSGEMLAMLKVPAAVLPEALPCTAHFGDTDASLFGTAIPITGIAGDQQAALCGQAGFTAGAAKCTYGTGSFVLANTGEKIVQSQKGLLTTVAFSSEVGKASYALEGAVFVSGAAVQWIRDEMGFVKGSPETDALARSVPDSGGVVFVPAFVGLGAPHWDPYARGMILGITRGTTRAHIVHAALESIACQAADVIRLIQQESGVTLTELRVDGGVSQNDFAMQRQADLLGIDVVRPVVSETTALGAAYLAGLGAGIWKTPDDVASKWKVDQRYKSSIPQEARAKTLRRWARAIERCRGWDAPEDDN